MIGSQVKISVSGNEKASIRRDIADILIIHGFKRMNYAHFMSNDGLRPVTAIAIINSLYELEAKYPKTSITTLFISSTLVSVELRMDKNRSV
jgi:2-C-methyl-D-erythritol 4-phosphate cytidylyltransferase